MNSLSGSSHPLHNFYCPVRKHKVGAPCIQSSGNGSASRPRMTERGCTALGLPAACWPSKPHTCETTRFLIRNIPNQLQPSAPTSRTKHPVSRTTPTTNLPHAPTSHRSFTVSTVTTTTFFAAAMRLPTQYLLLIGLSLLPATLAVSEPPEKPVDPECTVTSPFSENFFDLRKLRRLPDMLPPQADWHVKGLDYGANFSINICGPVLTEISPEGANDDAVGAFYEKNGTVYSIGYALHPTPPLVGRRGTDGWGK